MSVFDELRKSTCPSELVTVRGKTFCVTGLSLNASGALAAKCRKSNGLLEGDKLDRAILEACVTDPQTGERFTSKEWGESPRAYTGPLSKVALDLSGFDESDIQRDPKDSGSIEN